MKNTVINGRWELLLPEHRADRHEWPWWEATRLAAMHHFIKPGDVVWDIGAEEGDFPALFASWGARVVLVEPNPRVWPNIRAIFEANRLTYRIAGFFVGFASDVNADALDGLSTSDALGPDMQFPDCAFGEVIGNHGFRHLAQETDTTPQMTIDTMRERFTAPTHITMDIEGAELRALRGATGVLAEDRPYVWVSVHPDAMMNFYKSHASLVYALMESANYQRVFLTYDHESHELFVPNEKCWVL